MNWKILLSISVALSSLVPTISQAQAPSRPEVLLPDFETGRKIAERYSEQEILRHLKILASDSLEGRETGLRGQKMATDYLEAQFRHLGLKPLFTNGTDSSYRQVFPIYRSRVQNAGIVSNGRSFTPGRDFLPLPPMADSLVANGLKLVFAAPGPLPKNVEGNVVLILDTNIISKASPWRRLSPIAAPYLAAGAQYVLVATPFKGYTREVAGKGWGRFRNGTMSLEMPASTGKTTRGMSMISMQMAGQLLGSDSATLTGIAASKGGTSSKKQISKLERKDHTVDVDFRAGRDELGTENVGALLVGKTKPDELVVLTAHYDHLGIMNGQVYNGADDDGSGTSNVLEMARLFADAARTGQRPNRSVAFLLFTGEEKGLLGSEYYSQHPAFPMAKTSADINTDMIGRIDGKQPAGEVYTYMIGSDKISRALDDLVKETNRQCCNIKLDYTYNDENHPDQYYYRSDHYNFAKKGVPVAFFFTGVHPDYHEPTDDIDKILLPRISAIGKYIFLTAWGVAQRPTMLERVK